ncbi:hypothetical protein [Cellulomonas endophytica]|uniref:hypothetical protein n=1 Tax=Cellulomonas endophytica TaxID=2494735 RepID=UPI001012CF52|nr:hypothetical protein [Cellulomonas endophytica]
MRTTKRDLVSQIADRLGVPAPKMSTGSTEPKEIFLLVNDVLGLGLDGGLTKPELARAIVESTGEVWSATCESRGGTVTLEGLRAIEAAVSFFSA